MNKILLGLAVASMLMCFAVPNTEADSLPDGLGSGITTLDDKLSGTGILGTNAFATDGRGITAIIENIIKWLLSFAAILALGALLYGSVIYITSLGDESKTSRAKKIIIYAIFGLIVTGGSFVVVQTIKTEIIPLIKDR